MPPDGMIRGILFLSCLFDFLFFCLSVCLSVVKFNLPYNFGTVRDRDFRPKKINVEFPLTLLKQISVDGSVIIFFFNFMCYFMRTLVEMLIFILFHKVLSKLFNDYNFCSPHSVVHVLQFYIVLSALLINNFANKICRVGAIK